MSDPDVMDVEQEELGSPSSSGSPALGPGAFTIPNGLNHTKKEDANEESSPVPPPHRAPVAAPIEHPPPPSKPTIDAEACKNAGNRFFRAGDFDKAIREYSKGKVIPSISAERSTTWRFFANTSSAIEADPQSPTYLSNRSAALISANRYHEALEDAKMADELDPGNSKILLRLARIYTNLGRPSEALDIYNQIHPPISAKDKSPAVFMQTHIKQARDALREGTTGSLAIHALDQAGLGLGKGVEPPREWKLLRGEAYLKMGNANALGDAQNVALSLLRNNSQDPEALVLRGRALYAQGDNEKALQHFRQALNCDPDFKDGVKYLRMVQKLDRMKEEGNASFKVGRYKEAVDVYGAALEVDPLNKGTNSKILRNRAMALIKVTES
jgi:DnaJ family protein C protein 7